MFMEIADTSRRFKYNPDQYVAEGKYVCTCTQVHLWGWGDEVSRKSRFGCAWYKKDSNPKHKLANYGPWAKSGLQSINKVLLEYSYAHSFT